MKQLVGAARVLAIILLTALAAALPVLAHGVRVTHSVDPTTGEVTLTGAFDTGEPLADAQVIIFAPNDLANPWATGVASAEGVYTFLPDYTIEGYWEVQMRMAGHGGLVNLEIRADMAPASPVESAPAEATGGSALTLDGATQVVINGNAEFVVSGDVVISASGGVVESSSGSSAIASPIGSGFTPAQVAIMSAAVIWGFVGTALYFAGRRKK